MISEIVAAVVAAGGTRALAAPTELAGPGPTARKEKTEIGMLFNDFKL